MIFLTTCIETLLEEKECQCPIRFAGNFAIRARMESVAIVNGLDCCRSESWKIHVKPFVFKHMKIKSFRFNTYAD